jgi:hypothetical protein
VINYHAWQAYSEALGACPAEIDDPEIHDPIIDFAEHTPVQLYSALCKLRALAFGLPKSISRTFILTNCAEAMRLLEIT